MKRLSVSFLSVLFVSMSGCTGESGDPQGPDRDQPLGTGAQLSVDYFGDTDVVGFHFEIERVNCFEGEEFDPLKVEANVDLLDGIFPGMVQHLEYHPLDPLSGHLGADFFITLPPGCYDVTATPASFIDGEEWLPSEDCASVSTEEAIEVVAGQTTEVPMLISQCVGDPNGALDIPVALNHPPQIKITIDEKFNYECEPVNICAIAYDVDDDPIELEWLIDPEPFSVDPGPLELIGFENGHRIWQQCAEIVTQDMGSYEVKVTAYDLGWKDGELVRMEDITGNPSNAMLTVPIFTNWVEEPLCFNEEGELVFAPGVSIERAPKCKWISAEDFYCSGKYDEKAPEEISELVCDGEDLIEHALYPDC